MGAWRKRVRCLILGPGGGGFGPCNFFSKKVTYPAYNIIYSIFIVRRCGAYGYIKTLPKRTFGAKLWDFFLFFRMIWE